MDSMPENVLALGADSAGKATPGEKKTRRGRKLRPAGRDPLLNREYSWLDFNRRVLGEAETSTVPLLERLKFIAITANNLDEFLMVRLGGIRDMIAAGISERSPDGLTASQQLKGVRSRVRQQQAEIYNVFETRIRPALAEIGIVFVSPSELPKKERARLTQYFKTELEPILTPLAFDPGHPFPFLSNQALNLGVHLESSRGEEHLVFVKIPAMAPRFIPTTNARRFVPIERLIAEHVGVLFPGLTTKRVTPFRVIRNADILIREDDVQQSLLQTIETELRRRDRREVVWIDVEGETDEALINLLVNATHVERDDVFCAPGPLRLSDFHRISDAIHKPALKDPPFNPRIPPQLATNEDIFTIIRRGDVLLHRPYDSFSSVVELVQAAAEDPDVVAIKQTLYRSDPASPIVDALAQAAMRGKQVAVVVELQARFDERKNIGWARQLEEAGVQVVYGLVGVKTHCKLCLVVRREGDRLRRYVHLSTGNYNATTARLYTDLDLFTTDDDFGDDASQLMNILTGFSLSSVQEIFEGTAKVDWKKLVVSPMDYHDWTLQMIEREAGHAAAGKPGRIVARMNSLVDPKVISALYKASRAGVKIDLLVRGICCLVPGVEGVSENIRVTSIVDRFLEHVRAFHFRNGGNDEVWVSSGDWMPRNFFRRVEVTFPIASRALQKRLTDEILATGLQDTVKAWALGSDGVYRRRDAGTDPLRSQDRFIEIARAEAIRSAPYEEAIRKAAKSRKKAKKKKARKE